MIIIVVIATLMIDFGVLTVLGMINTTLPSIGWVCATAHCSNRF